MASIRQRSVVRYPGCERGELHKRADDMMIGVVFIDFSLYRVAPLMTPGAVPQ
jgi:hypothetical protein